MARNVRPVRPADAPDRQPASFVRAAAGLLAGILLTALPVLSHSATPTDTHERQYKSYDYKEASENAVKEVRLTIPEDTATVRGILVVSNSAGGDSREYYHEIWYGEFLYLHDFAFLGTKGFNSHAECVLVMQNALREIAKQANHPELVNVPYVTTGFSAGGGFASRLLVEVPDRVIACVPYGSRLNFTGITPTAAHLATPAAIITGEHDASGDNMGPVIEPVLEANRPKGALFSWMTVQGGGHARMGQEVLAMPLLDVAARLRYPADANVLAGPVKLKALDPASGWVADNTTWKSGLAAIAPAREFKGDIGKSSWLPTEDIAFIYRAYATYDRPLAITLLQAPSGKTPTAASASRALESGSDVTIMVDDSRFKPWKKLEFYDGARKLGEVVTGLPQLMATKLAAGYHVFSVLGTDAQENVRTSNPMMVVVRKGPTTP